MAAGATQHFDMPVPKKMCCTKLAHVPEICIYKQIERKIWM